MRVVDIRKEEPTIYIGRPSPFSNPFRIGVHGNREEVIQLYEDYALRNHTLLNAIRALPEDAVLGCYCHPEKCHGDVIVKLWKELHGEVD